jgi:hypothetical protein
MGQYFKAVNLDKEEVVCPWCMGGVAKLWEWAVNPWGAVFTLLLRKSDGSGGGDFFGYRGGFDEGSPLPGEHTVVGRWAGDRVVLVGDYDSSGLFEKSETKSYRNISKELVEVWNDFIEIPRMKLNYNADCSCQDK